MQSSQVGNVGQVYIVQVTARPYQFIKYRMRWRSSRSAQDII